MIKFYDISKAELDSKEFEEGALYCCNDTGEIYLDSAYSGERKQINIDFVICASTLPLAPIPNKIYAVIKTGTLHTYIDGNWVDLSCRPQLHFQNIVVANGSLVVKDDKILSTDTAVFVPDLSVVDLVENISASCANGSVTITVTSEYDIPGVLIVN